MKPILLQGHARSITQIKYNGEDLLFSVAKDPVANVWCSVPTTDTRELCVSDVRTRGFDFSGGNVMFSTDKQMGSQCFMNLFNLRDPQIDLRNQPYRRADVG